MSDLYIGNRLSAEEMSKVLNKNATRLNNSLSENLRSIALSKGIAKTQRGAKLMFYKVTKDEYENLVNETAQTFVTLKTGVFWRPLIAVDSDALTEAMKRVNANYPRRMDLKTHSKYLKELKEAMDVAVVKINEDGKTVRNKAKESKGNTNNLGVGDLTLVSESKYYYPKLARITKTSEKSFWYEFILPEGEVVSNIDYALRYYKDVKVFDNSDYGTDFEIPYSVNQEKFQVALDWKGNAKVGMKRWDGESAVQGYRIDTYPSD